VAYRYFATQLRSFIVADTPGHDQYTRNMAVGASCADLAILLIDATRGVVIQTKRHLRICTLMGIKHFVVVVNKMDLVDYKRDKFEVIRQEIDKLFTEFEFASIHVIPVSAVEGDNITTKSQFTPWFEGLPLLPYLETIETEDEINDTHFVMPVQRVSRPDHTFRGFQGQIECGHVNLSEEIMILPGEEKAKVKKILAAGRACESAGIGEAVTLQLDREVDVSRGCVLTNSPNLETGNMFTATILWMDGEPLIAGRNYIIKIGTKLTTGMIMSIKYAVDISDGHQIPTDTLSKNDIALCDVYLSENVAFETFKSNKALGSFILIDKVSNLTSACGVIEHSLRRATNVIWQEMDITRKIRSEQKNQKPYTLWFTGLSGSGKSTLANEIEKRLVAMGKHTMLLDGDNVRHGLNKNLGFKEADRIENIRRIAEVARLMNEAGLIVITSFISPYERDRENAREIIGEAFLEIYVNTPLSECEKRDVKGLYQKARSGEIPNFTGVSSPYEQPCNPDIEIDTTEYSINQAAELLMKKLLKKVDNRF
jgi:bifunctional enzyme CysN/CysC